MNKLLQNVVKVISVLSILFWSTDLMAQSTVSGQVTDAESGESLPGVNIVLQGTGIGTSTNADGRYELEVPSLQNTLVFSFIGYQQQVVPINGRSNLDVELSSEVIFGEELVVVAYGVTRRADLTTSVSSVDVKNIPVAAKSNVNDLLFGQAAGLQVRQESAQPGGGVDLSIRGRGNPLIVVDGVVFPNEELESRINFAEIDNVNRGSLAGLSPGDIESIEVLKDASASMYGVDASDGVILITTKKGSKGRLNVSYGSSVSFQQNTNFLEPLTAERYMRTINQLEEDRFNAENDMGPFGPNPSTFTPLFSEQEISAAGKGTNWVDMILRDGNLTNQNLSISGGSDRITYYFSGNFFNQNGTVENSDMQRYNGKAALTFEFNDFVTLNTSITGNKNFFNNTVAGEQTGGAGANGFTALQAAFTYPATLPVKDEDGNFTQFQLTGNPVSQLQIKDKTAYNSIFANFSVDFTLIPEMLTAKVLYGNNYETSQRDFFIPSTVNWFDANEARASLQQSERQYQTIESTFQFQKSDIGNFLDIDAVGGFGTYITDGFSFGVQARGVLDAVNTNRINGALTNGNSNKTRTVKRSFFARTTYDFLDKYILQGSVRYDGFNQFFPGNKFAIFPAVSAAWKVGNESFLAGSSILSELKIRASYGITGTPLPTGSAFAAFSPDNYLADFDDGGSSFIPVQATRLNHPNLEWQKTKTKNLGVDLGLFEDRFSASFDVFRDDVTRLLNPDANTPALSLLPDQPVNGGHQMRTGFEFDIRGDVMRSQDFVWNTGITFTHFNHRWEDRFEETDLANFQSVTDPVNVMYAFETDGILDIGQEIPAWQPEGARLPGAPIFVDQNGDGLLNSDDIKEFRLLPRASIGVNNTWRYKNFDLNMILYAQLGAYRQNNTLRWADADNIINGGSAGVDEVKFVWTTTNQDGSLPGASFRGILNTVGEGDKAVSGVGTDSYISKTDFLKARNISLGYTFNSLNMIRNLRVYVDVQNAFIITSFEGGDPEVDAGAVKGAPAPFPTVRTFSLGANVNF